MREPVLEVKSLIKSFGEKSVLRGVSFSVGKGECLGLLGESGCGKSTTAAVITGMLKPDNGSVFLAGTEAVSGKKTDRKLISRMVQMVFQDPYASFDPRMRLRDSVIEPLCRSGKPKEEIQWLAEHVFGHVNLNTDYLEKYPWEVSGGECQRAALARAIINKPPLLICDEATSALDVSVQAQIVGIIRDLQEELGLSVLFISHDVPLVCGLCDRIAVMQGGVIIENRETEELLAAPEQEYTKLLLSCS